MSRRVYNQPFLNTSIAIRQEIQRFESVHPSIYAIYDLIEAIPDPLIQQQIREHVVCIEDSFVNSQEWTLSRAVPDLKLGILGTVNSGKSALVHRYLTGSYMQEESPEGGRFKKEVVIDGQSFLLLIRDEGGAPEMQFAHWCDAVIFVFSLENESSLSNIYSYYVKMAHYCDMSQIPMILVGTQDAISESNPRVIDDTRARKLAADLRKCTYYETCATYGLNVERVFQDACQKIVHQRLVTMMPPVSPHPDIQPPPSRPHVHQQQQRLPHDHGAAPPGNGVIGAHGRLSEVSPPVREASIRDAGHRNSDSTKTDKRCREHREKGAGERSGPLPAVPPPPPGHPSHGYPASQGQGQGHGVGMHAVPVPCPLPPVPDGRRMLPPPPAETPPPLNARRDEAPPTPVDRQQLQLKSGKNGDAVGVGSGRAIPLKQGTLYKKSSKPLSREWKKKFVTLLEDGRLVYYPNLQEYMEDTHGKDINLINTTVKIPGQRPRGSRPQDGGHGHSNGRPQMGTGNVKDVLALFESSRDGVIGQRLAHNDDESVVGGNLLTTPDLLIDSELLGESSPSGTKAETPNVKKKHRRARSGVNKNLDASQDGDSDGYEFHIVSLDNRQWYFEAQSNDEREEWVQAIEQQILSRLQGLESTKSKCSTDPAIVQTIRAVKGNHICSDCDSPGPDWASINLGTLICIECSGIHRNLGTHLSRVRSLDLDEWSNELVQTMTSIGNALANSIWECNPKGRTKPSPTSSREEKERWIRSKYDTKEFLPPPPYPDVPLVQQLIDAVARQNVYNTVLVLAYIRPDQVNAPYSKTDTRTALHLAAALSNCVLLQLLLWYGADGRLMDHERRDALWYARFANSQECVNVLRSHGYASGEVRTLPRPPRASQSQAPGDSFDSLPNNGM